MVPVDRAFAGMFMHLGPAPQARVCCCCSACSMRALYGTDGTRNSCHGSDSPASAAREIKFFFPDLKFSTAAATATEDAKVSWLHPNQRVCSLMSALGLHLSALCNGSCGWCAEERVAKRSAKQGWISSNVLIQLLCMCQPQA